MKKNKILILGFIAIVVLVGSPISPDNLKITTGMESGKTRTDLEKRFSEDALINETSGIMTGQGQINSDWKVQDKHTIDLGMRYIFEATDYSVFAGFMFQEQLSHYSFSSIATNPVLKASPGATVGKTTLENMRRLYQDLDFGIKYPITEKLTINARLGQRLVQISGSLSQTGFGQGGTTGASITDATAITTAVPDVNELKGHARGNFFALGLDFKLNEKITLFGELLYSGNLNGHFTQFGRPSQMGSVSILTVPAFSAMTHIYENNSGYRLRFNEQALGFQYDFSKTTGIQFGFRREIVYTSYPEYTKSFAYDFVLLKVTGLSSAIGLVPDATLGDVISDAHIYGKEERVKSDYTFVKFVWNIDL